MRLFRPRQCWPSPSSPLRAGAETLDLVSHVDPFIGTDDSQSPHPVPGGAGGSTFPGATVPFGMVQLSPDTPTASPSGYRYSDTKIEAFSLTHFNGAGCPNNEDLPFMPFVGDLNLSPGTHWSAYASSFYKAGGEEASPGYYAVQLAGSEIGVQLTATTRTGFVRFTYPHTDNARLLLHPGRSATGVRDGETGDRRAKQDPGLGRGGGILWLAYQLQDLLRDGVRS